MLRSLVTLAILGALVFVGATVKIGKYTFFGHVSRIWKSDETQELVEGVKESSKPVVEKVKRGVKAGWEEIAGDGGVDGDAGLDDAGAHGGASGATGTGEAGPAEQRQPGGVLDGLRDRAVEEVSDRAGDAAKDAVKSEVKEKLSGDGARP